MPLNLLSFFVGVFLLLILLLIALNYKKGQKLNFFFLILIAGAGLKRFFYGIEVFSVPGDFKYPIDDNIIFPFFKFLAYFLFFDNLISGIISLKKVAFHLLFPILFAVTQSFFPLPFEQVQLIFLIFSTTYIGLAARSMWKLSLVRKDIKAIIHYNSIKKWAFLVFGVFVLIFIFSNYFFIEDSTEILADKFEKFYALASILWLLLIIYLFYNPILLYGDKVLIEKLNNSKAEEIVVWRNSRLTVTLKNDLLLEKKVNVPEIIFSIKRFEEKTLQNFELLPSLKEFAFNLSYPQSHLKFVFNYYSFCTFSEYQTVLKIKYAILQIKSGYLDTKTLDSLATRCHFTNRSTFYKNFKKYTGLSPTEYQSALFVPSL